MTTRHRRAPRSAGEVFPTRPAGPVPEQPLDGLEVFSRHEGCLADGQLRVVSRDEQFWTLACDSCDFRGQKPTRKADRTVAIARLMEAAELPPRFVDKPLEPDPGLAEAVTVAEFVIGAWPSHGAGPMLVGENGTGKTHLLVYTAQRILQTHLASVRYATLPGLLRAAKRRMDANEPVQEIFDFAASVDLLVLDDIGPELDRRWAQEVFDTLIDERYLAERPLIGATNVPHDDWQERFGHRAASRLAEMTSAIPVTGPDRRQQGAAG